MAASLLQLTGFMLSALGQFLISAATAMDMWSLQDRSFTVVTNVYTYSGLWKSCVGTSYGTTSCRPYFTILGLPALLQAVRALMIVGIVLGAIASFIAIFALKCLKMGNMEDNIKATMTLTAGIMFVVAGVVMLCSVFMTEVLHRYKPNCYFNYVKFLQYTFGPALFVGWIGAAILLIGGIMMCLACRGMEQQPPSSYSNKDEKADKMNRPEHNMLNIVVQHIKY
uniref:Claudin n=1 Tax=Acanthochromis polyacanthus TaxID=80966 RepID=A0A3Q1EXM3_9TELE